MQGNPIGSSAQGMKNTSDPAASTNPKAEGPGAITSDSLAAESARSGGGDTSTGSSGGSGGSGSNDAPPVDQAPTYIPSTQSQPHQSSGKPHGKNITEGGPEFDDNNGDGKNASFTAEIGSADDPGRKAVGDFQKMTQSVSGGAGPRQGTVEGGQGGFEALGEE